MPWIIYEPTKAEAAGCDMELGEVLFAMTVGDLAEVYQSHIDDELDQQRNDESICYWEQLSDQRRRDLVDWPAHDQLG